MPDSRRHDAFGRALAPPRSLRERVDVLRKLVGSLQASRDIDERWLGEKIGIWLQGGAPTLEAALGVSPGQPAAIVRQAEVSRMLLRLSALVGGDGRASMIMRGVEPAPSTAVELVAELRAHCAPTSRRAFVRARAATRKGHDLSLRSLLAHPHIARGLSR